ncbi:MAG: DUF4390 domain-containing protein [Comamonadaceae bacterium]|uniref:DUF4390 domain-containing protein n=1 Tax=Hydrogenophaga borbori TaxID=2294117 RepID=A0A372EKS1_9BURK|nr:DUF4390 domain-containing protein [Comamonadaceae bacterium]RFP79658.1 DUF4390 domain-containing protein [Hydrogenophaga borbori]
MPRVDRTAFSTHVLTRPAAADRVRSLLRPRHWLLLVLVGLALALARAQPPQVQQLALQRTSDGLFLSARFELSPHGAVQDALIKGVPLYFVWQADVLRERWYWTNKRVAGATRTLRLAYQPLTRRWRVSISTEAGGGTGGGAGLPYALHQNHDTLEEALAAVGRVSRWRLADAGQLEPGASHLVEFGFRLDLSLLPRPFQIGLGNQEEWSMALERELGVPEAATPELPAPAEPRATSPAAEAKAGGEAPAAESPSR